MTSKEDHTKEIMNLMKFVNDKYGFTEQSRFMYILRTKSSGEVWENNSKKI